MKTVIVYGSETGSTEQVAENLCSILGEATVFSASKVTENDLQAADLLILGASTWGDGELQEQMCDFLDKFSSMELSLKAGAVFGLGDQYTFSNTFVDGIADMVDSLKNKEIRVLGSWPVDGYEHSASRAQEGAAFLGLPLDQDNQEDMTQERLVAWARQIRTEFGD